MAGQSFTSGSSFSPEVNVAPDLLILEARFLDEQGNGLIVDSDLTLKTYEGYDTSPKDTFTFFTPQPIEQKVTSSGIYYFLRLNTTNYDVTKPIRAEWYAKVNGNRFHPYPIVKLYRTPTADYNVILLADEIKDWIKRQLGFPLTAVELTEDQLGQVIDFALRHYNRWVPKVKRGDIELVAGLNKYELPEVGRGVFKVDFIRREGLPLISDPLFGREYPRGQQLDFDQYQLGINFFKDLLKTTSQNPIWRWSPQDPKYLYINAQNQSYRVSYFYFVDHRLEEINPSHHEIFKKLCLAYAKKILGEVRRKYEEIPTGEGRLSLDGSDLIIEATTELKELDTILSGLQPRGACVWG